MADRWWLAERTPLRPPRAGLIRSHAAATLSVLPHETGESMRARQAGTKLAALPVSMVGYFSVTGRDTWSEIRSKREGHFLERVAPGAYRRTFAEDEIVPMFSHGHDPMFSERPLGVVRLLEEDTVGARFAVDLYDVPSIRELLPGLATNAYGSSYRFSVRDESWTPRPGKSFHNPTGLPERIIRDARVLEFGPTVFPAQKRTSAGLAQPGDPPAMQAASARIPAPRAARRPSASVPRAWRRTVPSSWR